MAPWDWTFLSRHDLHDWLSVGSCLLFEVEPISGCDSYLEGKNDQKILCIGAGDLLSLDYTHYGIMNFIVREEYLYFDMFHMSTTLDIDIYL